MFTWNKKKDEFPSIVNGQILFNTAAFPWEKLKNILKKEWDITVTEKNEENTLLFSIDNMLAACTFFPYQMSVPDYNSDPEFSQLWENNSCLTKDYKSFISITVTNGKSCIERHKLFTKIASSICTLNSALAVFSPSSIIPGEDYRSLAQEIKYNKLPIFLWVNFGFKMEGDRISAYTNGLCNFNKNDVEILYSKKSFENIFDFLFSLSEEIIKYESDMKTFLSYIKLRRRFAFRFSSGAYIKGKTLKISY